MWVREMESNGWKKLVLIGWGKRASSSVPSPPMFQTISENLGPFSLLRFPYLQPPPLSMLHFSTPLHLPFTCASLSLSFSQITFFICTFFFIIFFVWLDFFPRKLVSTNNYNIFPSWVGVMGFNFEIKGFS